jgi:hypothetical protein
LPEEKLSGVIKEEKKIWGNKYGISVGVDDRSIIANKEEDSCKHKLCGGESGASYRLLLLLFSIRGVVARTGTAGTNRTGVPSATRDLAGGANRSFV